MLHYAREVYLLLHVRLSWITWLLVILYFSLVTMTCGTKFMNVFLVLCMKIVLRINGCKPEYIILFSLSPSFQFPFWMCWIICLDATLLASLHLFVIRDGSQEAWPYCCQNLPSTLPLPTKKKKKVLLSCLIIICYVLQLWDLFIQCWTWLDGFS